MRWLLGTGIGFAFAAGVLAQEPVANEAVLDIARESLEHHMKELRALPEPAYFLAYEIHDSISASVAGSFGQLASSDESRWRQLDIDLRVGSESLDNTRITPNGNNWGGAGSIILPIDDSPEALRKTLWFYTDRAYKDAAEALIRVRTDVGVQVDRADPSDDFSSETPNQYVEPIAALSFERAAWEPKVRAYTATFADDPNIYDASVTVSATAMNRWLVNSEGSALQTGEVSYQLQINAMSRAEDGMDLSLYRSFYARDPADLPGDEAMTAVAQAMKSQLLALREAPLVDPYIGPAILSGRAAGVFFHEVLGHRLEGHKLKREWDGQTFKAMLGEQILPGSLSIIFDPTRRSLAGQPLSGHYRFDNEGVAAQAVTVIKDGVLENFLMSRDPIEGFSHSNGHGRRQAGTRAVARQSNLIVESADPVPNAELEAMLLERIRAEGKPYGLIFEDIQGGFTLTGRFFPNSFKVMPTLVYRLYPDGRRELVRGVDLIGTPLSTLKEIVAAGDQPEVFNGHCGAESGWVPVSASSPPLLVAQLEVQKTSQAYDQLPILPAPLKTAQP